jgi:hypothetical protein
MNKMSEMYDNTLFAITPLPCPDDFGQVRLSYQDLRKILEERRKLTYATGFFFGVACTMGRNEKV